MNEWENECMIELMHDKMSKWENEYMREWDN